MNIVATTKDDLVVPTLFFIPVIIKCSYPILPFMSI